ncbi:hypothetical protein DV515_00011705 [Chloebia gouldiae]|uniref:Uncharacterized protein n=1 Tax=Chloebia gouldiae TaxID=44316 RepID=A0A3L8S5H8_CHLGU|nr:hypothetical protein DV515_00011705 [Chloebia gouldiae]
MQAQKVTLGFTARSPHTTNTRWHWGCVLLSFLMLPTCSRRFQALGSGASPSPPKLHKDLPEALHLPTALAEVCRMQPWGEN